VSSLQKVVHCFISFRKHNYMNDLGSNKKKDDRRRYTHDGLGCAVLFYYDYQLNSLVLDEEVSILK